MMIRARWILRILVVINVVVMFSGAAYCVDLGMTSAAQGVRKERIKKIGHITTTDYDPSTTMVLIPAGNFNMGGDAAHSDALPVHTVYLDAYYIDKYEVTFDQYDAFCTATARTAPADNGWGRGTRPVINITWFDAEAYCTWAGKRLATEAEWEKACRGGTNTAFYWGDDPGYTLSRNYAWDYNNSPSGTQPVGGKLPNAFGLYDMSGNVSEWVNDWYDGAYYAVSPMNNPPGAAPGTFRVLRGGSWSLDPYGHDLRVADRGYTWPNFNGAGTYGCRCAKTP